MLNHFRLKTCYNPCFNIQKAWKSCFCLIKIGLKTKKIMNFRISKPSAAPQHSFAAISLPWHWAKKIEKNKCSMKCHSIRSLWFQRHGTYSRRFLIWGLVPQHSETMILVPQHSCPNPNFQLFFMFLFEVRYTYDYITTVWWCYGDVNILLILVMSYMKSWTCMPWHII